MPESKGVRERTAADDRDLYSGLIRLHVLHHAVEGPIFGLGMIEELARHGFRATPLGRKALAVAKNRVWELFHELIEGD